MGLTVEMKKRGFLSFYSIFFMLCTIPLIVTVYVFLHALLFPGGRLVHFIGIDYATDVLLEFGLYSSAFMLLGIPCFIYDRRERAVIKTSELQEIVRVISKIHFWLGTFTIVFEFPDDVRKTVAVSLEQYDAIDEGSVGLLTYKQRKKHLQFMNFEALS